MSNFPLIRTAVKIGLIAAIVIQPMLLMAAQGTCARGVSAGACCQAKGVFQACKCCEVKTDGNLCGCCTGKTGNAGDCSALLAADGPRHDEGFDPVSGVFFERSEADGLARDRKASLTACLCGLRTEPLGPTPHRIPVPQVRDLVLIAHLDHVAPESGAPLRPGSECFRLPIGDLSPHFSQRFLCIWRI